MFGTHKQSTQNKNIKPSATLHGIKLNKQEDYCSCYFSAWQGLKSMCLGRLQASELVHVSVSGLAAVNGCRLLADCRLSGSY